MQQGNECAFVNRGRFGRGRGLLLVLAMLALEVVAPWRAQAATQYPGGIWQPGPAQYGVTVVKGLPVRMDDGVILRAEVAYPTDLATGRRATGRFPVIVEHTPYVIFARPLGPIPFFAEHGYISVLVRARGAGESGGSTLSLQGSRDGEDGKTIVDWAAHDLQGSDGRVGIIGCSYPGGISLTDAGHVGPRSPLKAAVSACVGVGTLNRNGVWLLDGLPTTGFWFFSTLGAGALGNTQAAKEFFANVQAEIAAGGPAAYDGAFWQDHGAPMSLAPKIVANGVPVLLWSGWHDHLEPAALRTYAAFQNLSDGRAPEEPMTRGQRVTPRYQIIVGNWGHGEGLDVGIYLEWMDTWVRGVHTGLEMTDTPMHLYEIGTDHWINAARYPLVSSYTRWYLDAGGTLAETSRRSGAARVRFEDPAQPEGQLSFVTPPLPQGATLAGPLSARIYARSSNTNLELIARLYDVAPDRTETLVSKGAVLGSQRTLDPRASWTDHRGTIIWPWPTQKEDIYLRPGEAYRFDFALLPVQWSIPPGHRLRLELTTQSPAAICPSSGVPPQNGNDPCGTTAPQHRTLPGGVYTILAGPHWPSAINLPQLPRDEFHAVASGPTPTEWSEGHRSIQPSNVALPLDWGQGR